MSARPAGSRGALSKTVAAAIPEPEDIGAVRLPAVATSKSSTFGYEVVGIGSGDLPYFELRLRLDTGSAVTPKGSAVPRMLASSFLGGTRKRSSEDISRTLKSLGAGIACSLGSDGTVVSAAGLAENFEEILEILREVLFLDEYPDDEVEVSRSRVTQDLFIAHSQPSRIARDALRQAVYKDHPYGRPTPDPHSAARCRREDLLGLHRKVFRAQGGRFVVVSSLPNRRIARTVKDLFDDAGDGGRHWGRPNLGRIRDPKASFSQRTILVDRPGSVQTVVRTAMASPTRRDRDYHAFLLANTIFGGYFSSRLVENVREQKGYAYAISSSISHRRMASMVTVAADVATEVTTAALVEIFYELDRLRAAPPRAEEVDSARRYLVGSTGIALDTYAGTAGTLDSLYNCGLDESFLEGLRDRLYSVSPEDVYDAACEYFDRTRAVTVLVGDAEKIERPLRRVCGDSVEVVESAGSV